MNFQTVKNDPSIQTYIRCADESLKALGYTEHSFSHALVVAKTAGDLLKALGADDRTVELARIAGYLHDIGNLVNRVEHSQSGAVMAFRLLDHLGFPAEEIAQITTAIGNHDEGTGTPVNNLAAALILADKSDVRRSRVRNEHTVNFDIHDRVNYSVTHSELTVSPDQTQIDLRLSVDPHFSSVMEYFEIFMERMILCKKAAKKLNLEFRLSINAQQMI